MLVVCFLLFLSFLQGSLSIPFPPNLKPFKPQPNPNPNPEPVPTNKIPTYPQNPFPYSPINNQISVEYEIAGEKDSAFLSSLGFDVQVLPSSFKVVGKMRDRQRLVDNGFTILSEEQGRPFANIAPPNGYHTPEELMKEFENLASFYPSLASLIDLTETYKQPFTHEGRRIYALKISNNVQKDEDEPNILVVSNHHSRELITPELALNTSAHLIESYRTDAEVKKLLDENQVYVMWTLNPDGLAHVWAKDNMWRKNRNPAAGVDLNRNYPIGWDFSCAGSTIPASETYRGVAPASEPETQTMMAFQKERKFSKVLDFHSYAREVRIIYGSCASLPQTIDNYFKSVAEDLAVKMSYRQARSCCMAGDVHFAYHEQASLTFLVETGTAFQPNAEVMRQELVRVLPGTMDFLTLPIPLSGKITNRAGNPIEAKIELEGVKFELEEVNYSNPKNGLYHVWIPRGTWTLVFSAPSLPSQTRSVTISNTPTVLDIQL